MNPTLPTNRRTVLTTIPAALLGAGTLISRANAATDGAFSAVRGRANTLTVVGSHDHDAGHHAFHLETHEVPSGWTTLVFENRVDHTHFANLTKVPQAAIDEANAAEMDLLTYWIQQITNPFQGLMDWLLDEPPRYPPSFPDWLGEILPSGGVGLTAGGSTSTTTVHLDPGEYVLECYVKNGDNEFHSYLGMIDLLTVTDEPSDASEPSPTLDVSLSTDGIVTDETVRPGRHTVAVTFENQDVYSNYVGHDVHLLRLDDDTTAEDVNRWMNWMTADGLISDGTEPSTFLGGADTVVTPALLAGEETVTEYIHVLLTPGEYVWVSEVPDPMGKGLLKQFTVPSR